MLTFITGNQHKADLLSKYLNQPLEHLKLNLTEIQSLDVFEVVTHKVKEAYKIINRPVLVEDTSVVFHALGNLPGPFIKFFLQELSTTGICKLLENYLDKSATATVNFGYYDGKSVKIFSAEMKGTIAPKPQGNGGFGWDSTFIPNGFSVTRAQLNSAEYDLTSPRRQAVDKLKKYLESIQNV